MTTDVTAFGKTSRRTPSKAVWAGRVLSGLTILFMLMDAVMKLVMAPPSVQATTALGFPAAAIIPIGAIGLICTILYAIPRTAVLGAILLTGYYGGAIASQVRVDGPLFSTVLFGVYLGIIMWAGLWLRDARVRNLLSFGAR